MKKRSKRVEPTLFSHNSKKEEGRKVSAEHPIIKRKIRKALRHSLWDGAFSGLQMGFGISYFIAFALALNASASQIAILTAMIMLLPALIQIQTARLVERYSRKKITVTFIILQVLVFIPLIYLGLFSFLGQSFSSWILIIFIIIYYSLGSPAIVSWFSWMGSLVPEKERGKYFGKRNKIVQLSLLVGLILGGLILEYSKKLNIALLGFVLILFVAFLFRIISIIFLFKQYEPKIKINDDDEIRFFSFLKNLTKSPFGRFSVYMTILRFAIYLGIPFFTVYMLEVKGFSYLSYMFVTVALSVFMVIFYPLTGKIADRFGNIKLLRLASFTMAIYYLSWLFSSNIYYLVFIVQMLGGFAWAGILLATNNYIYDSISQKKIGFSLSNFNLLIGIGMGIGSGLGALLVLIKVNFLSPPLFIIGISSIVLILFYVFSEGWLREVRHVKQFRYQWLMREVTAGAISREIHELNHIKHKIEHYI